MIGADILRHAVQPRTNIRAFYCLIPFTQPQKYRLCQLIRRIIGVYMPAAVAVDFPIISLDCIGKPTMV